MKITHKIFRTDLKCPLDLRDITNRIGNAIYTVKPFKMVQWRHRKIGGTCLLYHSGKVIYHGDDERRLRKYCRIIQKMGYPIRFKKIHLVTMCGVYDSKKTLDYPSLVRRMKSIYGPGGVSFEPELYHAPMVKIGKISFTAYKNGKIIIAGIKSDEQIYDVVLPTLLEMTLD